MKQLNTMYYSVALLISFSLFPFQEVHAELQDPLVNGGFEQAGGTAQSAYDWQTFGSGYRRVNQPRTGVWSIRLQTGNYSAQAGAYQRIDVAQAELKPVFIGAYVRGQGIKNAPGGYFGASLYAEIHLQDGSVVYWNSVGNFGSFPWRWIGFNTGTLAAIDQPIDHILVIPILANAIGTAWFDDVAVTEFDPAQSAVTLMFDDGESTTLTEAKPILENFGMVGSAAIVTDNVGESGYMNLADLKALALGGWEIVSHGLTHSDLTALSERNMKRELQRSKQILEGFGFTVRNFALPFGAYNAAILAEGAKLYNSVRAYELGDNPQGAFPYDVKVRSVVNTTTLTEVSEWLAKAAAEKRWEVLVFHSISETGDDAYHVSPDMLHGIIQAIVGSGIPVVTYNAGLQLFSVK